MAVECLRLIDVFAATLIAARTLNQLTPNTSVVNGFDVTSESFDAPVSARGYTLRRMIKISYTMTSAISPAPSLSHDRLQDCLSAHIPASFGR